MAEHLREILVGRKILNGKLLPPGAEVTDLNTITVERFLDAHQHGEIYLGRFERRGGQPFFMRIPAPPPPPGVKSGVSGVDSNYESHQGRKN